jgi:hypothetical protein
MKSRDLKKIYTLMSENLEEDSSNTYDLLMWFQAYRRLSDFEILEAIDRFGNWALREDSVEAHYYLYILYFIRWRQGILGDHRLIIEHKQKCSNSAVQLGRTRSYEWYADKPVWCPLVHQSELGEWDNTKNFFDNTEPLAKVDGVIKTIKGPQSGLLALGPLDVFFVPGNEFLAPRDLNKNVKFCLGFSYDGLRGWRVKRQDQ